MAKLNEDVLFLIFEKLHDKNSLYPCLLVNKAWCKISVPILWRNPWKPLEDMKKRSQLNVIISHLSNETKEYLSRQGIDLSTAQQKPLFDYISFCRYLSLQSLKNMIVFESIYDSRLFIIRNEILKLFVNNNTRFTHLHMPLQYSYQIHLIPGAEHCFSELKFFYCNDYNNDGNQNVLEGLARISKSIKKLECSVDRPNNFGIIKLIEAQKNLNDIHVNITDKSFCKSFEESLIKHADTIKFLKIYWNPITKFLSYLVNLVSLELHIVHNTNVNHFHLENAFLPILKILKTRWVPFKSITSLIENTKGLLTEISVDNEGDEDIDNERLIQAIYQNCPKLEYLKLLINNNIIMELEKLLINCQHLNGLVIITYKSEEGEVFGWDSLFEILANSSPTGLFKFKFKISLVTLKLVSLKLFFDNWKKQGRQPMLLQTNSCNYKRMKEYVDLFEKYIAEGIIKKYDHDENKFKEFEWIQKN